MRKYNDYIINKPLEKLKYIKTSRKNENVLEKYICLDTETAHVENITWVYQWAFTFNGGLYCGRTPSQLVEAIAEILTYYKSNENNKIFCFVHNLPYDFSYFSRYLDDAFTQQDFMLADANHKVFQVSYDSGLVLRCSYKLTNKSLDKASQDLGTKHKKLVGTVDYTAVYNQYDKLTRTQWHYMYNDCIVLDEIIEKQLELYKDNIASMPITSTSYVEREIKREYKRQIKKNIHIMSSFQKQKPTPDAYYISDAEFSGGYVHGNRKRIEEKVIGNIRHRDFQSMYPSEIKSSDYYPVSKFIKYCDIIKYKNITDKMREKYCILCVVDFKYVTIDRACTFPYIQFCHIEKIVKTANILTDNGRLLECDKPFTMTLDINELDIILKQYKTKICIKQVYIATRGHLPDYITKVIDDNYIIKTRYKIIVKQCKKEYENNPTQDNYIKLMDAELTLMKSKNILNGIYGCMAKNPIRNQITFKDGIWKTENKKNDAEYVAKTIDKYYNNPSKCLHFAQGCYTTINARLRLFEMLYIVGYDNFLYCDTDSIFYLSNDEIERKINAWNDAEYKKAMQNGYYVEIDGHKQHYREFSDENENITAFKFLHSKCYLYQTVDGQYYTTIAGVRKFTRNDDGTITTAIDELKAKNKDPFKAFKKGMIFVKCGGTKAQYIDNLKLGIDSVYFDYNGNETQGGCIITPTTKTLNYEDADDTFIISVSDMSEEFIK